MGAAGPVPRAIPSSGAGRKRYRNGDFHPGHRRWNVPAPHVLRARERSPRTSRAATAPRRCPARQPRLLQATPVRPLPTIPTPGRPRRPPSVPAPELCRRRLGIPTRLPPRRPRASCRRTRTPQVPPDGTFGQMTRFLQQVSLESTWMYKGDKPEQFTDNTAEASATFAVPFLTDIQNPLLITQGFAFHYWDGPDTPLIDLPPRVYDAYLDTAWYPRFTHGWAASWISAGVCSDFMRSHMANLRFTGRGLAVVILTLSLPTHVRRVVSRPRPLQAVPGRRIVWLPSSGIRLLHSLSQSGQGVPAGNGDHPVVVVLPRRIRRRSWIIEDPPGRDGVRRRQVDYNDIRVGLGLEFRRFTGPTGLVEVGWSTYRGSAIPPERGPRHSTTLSTCRRRPGVLADFACQ